MLSVDEAITAILDGVDTLGVDVLPLDQLTGRVAAGDVTARLTQPPFDASAMDGYAVKFDDAKPGAVLTVIGEAPAGDPYKGEVGRGEAVRLFTGSVVPDGADHIVIQEDVTRKDDTITVNEAQDRRRHIRKAGIDFRNGDVLVRQGEMFHQIHGSILAAANISEVAAYRAPRVALFSNGDELVEPGSAPGPGQIINSNHFALAAMLRAWGATVEYLGCASDNESEIERYLGKAREADIIVPVGGASVGDYDFVKSAFRKLGGRMIFEKVAVRPGKPTWCGKLGVAKVIGLPGNPASAIVTAALFLQPLVKRMAGLEDSSQQHRLTANLAAKLEANGGRESYLRAEYVADANGRLKVTPAANQDSSLLSPFANANCLIRRLPNAAASEAGDEVEIVRLR